MRLGSGAISFSELANRVQKRREAKGMSPAAARIPRFTIYDALRPGRRRLAPDLVEEIVLALGGSESDADAWRRACVEVMSAENVALRPPVGTAGLLQADHSELAVSAAVVASAAPAPGTGAAAERDKQIQSATPLDSSHKPQILSVRVGTTTVLIVFMLGIFINVFAHVPVDPLGLPVYLDMIGTAIAAIMLGPWVGAAVGLSSSLLSSTVIMDWPGMSFALVNVAGGLIWGFGFHRWRMRTPLKFLLLNVVVAIGCTLVAVPVLVLVFGGSSGTSQDTLVPVAELIGRQLWTAVLSSNLLTSVADKLISGVLALGVSWVLWGILRRRGEKFGNTDLTP